MMKEQLLNHTRKQRWLLVLLVLALLPQWTLAQNSIVIAGTPVSASGPVTGSNISGSVSMDFDNNILTLSNATIDGTIDGGIMWNNTGGDDLTIKMSGKNSIVVSSGDAIDAQQSCSLHIKKISTAESATLKYYAISTNFVSDCEGFKEFYNVENGITYRFFTTKDVYDLKVCNDQIQVHDIEGELGYKGNVLQESGTPTVTFDNTTNTLTLDNATLTSNIGWESDSKALTIALKGKNSITSSGGSCIVITGLLMPARQRARKKASTATISFVKDGSSSDPCSLTLSCPTGNDVIEVFANSTSPGMGTGLSWIVEEEDANKNIVKAAVAEDYNIEIENNKKVHSGNASDVLGDGKVSYDVVSNTLTLKDGATISTYGINYFGATDLTIAIDGTVSVIGSTCAVYSNGGKLIFAKATGAICAELTASCGDGYPPIGFYSSSLGDGMYWSPVSSYSIIITDDASKAMPAPTIAFDANKDYLATDKIEVTRNSNDHISIDIFYTWGDAVIGTVYKPDDTAPTLTQYDGTNKIPVESGTLRAWVGYAYDCYGEIFYVLSEASSQAFTVKKDIALCTVTLPESATYIGEAYEPIVRESAAATTDLTLGTDYTVKYQKTDSGTATDVDEMIEVGTYKIIITGKGDYTGSKEVSGFQIGKATLADAVISKLMVGNTEYTGTDIEIPYTGEAIQPSVVVTFNNGKVTVDASEYSVAWSGNTEVSGKGESAKVTVTSTGKNFTADTYTSKDFKIVPASVTITANDQTVTYNGEAQAYTGASVDNAKAVLSVAYYESNEDRTNDVNALTGAPTNAGTYYIKVTQTDGHYTANAKNATFTIDQLSLTGAVITLDKDELDYNGTELTVGVTKVMVGTIEVPAASYEVGGNKQTEPGEYTLTVTAKVNEGTFKNNFKGSATATYTVKKNLAVINFLEGLTYMTYYNANTDLFLPDGVTAYIVTGTDGAKVTVTKVSYLKAGVPLLLEKTDGSTTVVDPNDSFDGNKLVYVSSDLTTTSQQYVLYNNEFVKASGTIPAGKVYLEVDITSAARVLTIGEGTTGIDNLQLDNLQIDNWYDLQGRRIDKPTKKGIYILNGKKTAIK